MSNSVDPDGTVRHEPSHRDIHCLQRRLNSPMAPKGLNALICRIQSNSHCVCNRPLSVINMLGFVGIRTGDPLHANPTLYHVAIKAGLHCKAVQMYLGYTPLKTVPIDISVKMTHFK